MATEADRVRHEIETTRHELARDVDRLADRVSPSRNLRRRMEGIKGGMRSIKDRVIGASESAATTVGDAAADVGATVKDAATDVGGTVKDVAAGVAQTPKQLARATQGNPVAVGLIAFGGGLLAATLVPETEAERRAVKQLGENMAPLVEPLQEAGRAFAADVRDSVEAGVAEVRTVAGDAAEQVRAVATEGAAELRSAATGAVTDARDAATHTIHEVTEPGPAITEQRRSLEP
jgi:Protein of unknown function (DUF3618)